MSYTLSKSYYIIDSTDGMNAGKVVSIVVGDNNTEETANTRANELARANPGKSYDVAICLTRRSVSKPVFPPITVYGFTNG